jgi:uncharacterized protein with HEPN domain
LRSDRLYLQDMLGAIIEIERHLPGDRAQFDGNPFLQSHILRYVQIVGEAAARISHALKDQNPQVAWRQISGMRHVLVHDYFRVDWNIVFITASDDIPTLRPQIEAILSALPPGTP